MKNSFISSAHLDALLAVAEEGTFEEAGMRLGISTSAVSQRIRALEARIGAILLTRSSPVSPTHEGTILLGLARKQALLTHEALSLLDEGAGARTPMRVPLVVNEDSLATWFLPVLAEAARIPGIVLDLKTANEGLALAMIRDARAMAGVSTAPRALAGCRARHLGALIYEPLAAPALLARSGPLPRIHFDADDDLQDRASAGTPLAQAGPVHFIPDHPAFEEAIAAGCGWGMVPIGMGGPGLVRLPGARRVAVDLYWHRWSLESRTLDLLEEAAVRAFAAHPSCSSGISTTEGSAPE